MVDQTTNLSSEFVEQLEADYPEIAGSPVAESANIANGQADGRTLFAFEDDELYNTGQRARRAYRELTDDLLTRLTQ
jgi:chromosome partitioning protein